MKVFVAGGSGAMGRRLVPQLVAAGYEVVAMTRDQDKASWLRRVGAQPAIADALDRAGVVDVVKRSEPEIVIHQLTALAGAKSFKNFDKSSRSPIAFEPRAPITCLKLPGWSGSAASSRRATETGATSEPDRRSRPRMTRSTRTLRRIRSSHCRQSAMSRTQS